MKNLVQDISKLFKEAKLTPPIFTDETALHVTYGLCLWDKTVHVEVKPEDMYILKEPNKFYTVVFCEKSNMTGICKISIWYKKHTYTIMAYPIRYNKCKDTPFTDGDIVSANGHTIVQRMLIKAIRHPTNQSIYYAIHSVSILENWLSDTEIHMLNYLLFECEDSWQYIDDAMREIIIDTFNFYKMPIPDFFYPRDVENVI